jgi:hypothetical protein
MRGERRVDIGAPASLRWPEDSAGQRIVATGKTRFSRLFRAEIIRRALGGAPWGAYGAGVLERQIKDDDPTR